jgi:capsular exopolysaccharide synthesis family protein
MGRIAEALKRAQLERARKAQPDGRAEGTASRLAGPEAGDRLDAVAPPDDVLSASIIEPPPLPRPFLSQNAPVSPDAVSSQIVAFHHPTSPIAEQYRSVRTRLLTSNPAGSARVLAVTSGVRREGKTITVANLGFSLAELRHLRVAMVDLDFRQRGLSSLFGVSDRPGMAEVLRGEKPLADVCLPVVRGNLYFIPAGNPGDVSPSELLAGGRAVALFRELTDRFHHNLVDTPPMHTVADIGMIAPLCHSVMIVIRMNRTPEPVLRRCVKMLQANHISIIGCVLAGYSDESGSSGDSHDYYQAEQ